MASGVNMLISNIVYLVYNILYWPVIHSCYIKRHLLTAVAEQNRLCFLPELPLYTILTLGLLELNNQEEGHLQVEVTARMSRREMTFKRQLVNSSRWQTSTTL